MDIDSVVSRLKEPKELNDKQCVHLKEVLGYIHNDGANKFRDGELFTSQKLTSLYDRNLLTSDAVLSEFILKLSRSEPKSVKNIINHYMKKLANKSREAQQNLSQRKSARRSMIEHNTDVNYAPPSEDGSFPGGPKYSKTHRSFERKRQKIGGKRTKHKRHNTNKTRRRRQSQTGR
jgi:hypothetical protein